MASTGKGSVLKPPAGNKGKGSGPGKPGGTKLPGDPFRKNLGGA